MSLLIAKKRIISPTDQPTTGGVVFWHDDIIRIPTILTYHNNHGNSNGYIATLALNGVTGGYIAQVQTLYNAGYELANHTETHYSTLDAYMATHTAEQYYNEHLAPVDSIITGYGQLPLWSFVWPTGATNSVISDWLIANNKFNILRNYSVRDYPASLGTCLAFYNGGRIADAVATDHFYGAFAADVDYHKTMMDYAKENGLVIHFLAHDVRDEGTFNPSTDLCTSTEDINARVAYAQEIGLPILTAKEAYEMYN